MITVDVFYKFFKWNVKAWWIPKPRVERGYVFVDKPLPKGYYLKVTYVQDQGPKYKGIRLGKCHSQKSSCITNM